MIITIASNKGGAAKTTTAAALAHGLAIAGHIVYATDFDRQGHLAITFGLPPAPGVFNHLVSRAPLQSQLLATGRPNLSILPGNSHTEEANTVLRTIHTINNVPDMVRQIATGADYLIIDTPTNGYLQEIAITVADIIISPLRPEHLGVDGLQQTIGAITKLNPNVKLCILPTMFDGRLREHNDQFQLLKVAYPTQSHNCIPSRVAVAEACAEGKTIWEYKHPGIQDVQQAYQFLIDWITTEGS